MQDFMRSIEAFCHEWSMWISLGLIVMTIVMFLVSRGWFRADREHRKVFVRQRQSYDWLMERYKVFEKIAHGFVSAIRGLRSRPDVWLKELPLTDGNLWNEIFGKWKVPSSYVMPEDVRLIANLIFNLRSAMTIFSKAEEGCQNGYCPYEHADKMYDITALYREYLERIEQATEQLHHLGMEPLKDHLVKSADKAIQPFIIECHVNEARYLMTKMRLGTDQVDIRVAKEFVRHCIAANADSFSFLDPDNPQHTKENMSKILEAVALINQQAEPPDVKEAVTEE